MVSVYLLHFDRPYKHARHYLGSAKDLQARLEEHRNGTGSRLMAVLKANGIGFTLVRVWRPNKKKDGLNGRELEARLKRHQKNCKLCPLCNPAMAGKMYKDKTQKPLQETDNETE